MTEILTCSRILSLMVFLGFVIHHMLRVNISIAIVKMIKTNSSSGSNGPQFDWSQEVKNNVLGSFYWGYIITQIPGGYLAEVFGTRLVMGIGLLVASLSTFLTPLAPYFHHYWLYAARFCLGLGLGVQWPAVFPLTTRWIPPAHTSKFISHTMASSLGAGLTLPACGYLISKFEWPTVFYITGIISLVWVMVWFYLVYDSPSHHPRISQKEKENLEKEVVSHVGVSKIKVPLKDILTSGPVWSIVVGCTMHVFPFFVILNHLPTYMNDVLHFSIQEIGWLSSFPYLGKYFSAVVSSYIADKLIETSRFSRLTVRKGFTLGLFSGPFLFMCVQAIWGYDRIVSIVVFVSSLVCMGWAPPSLFANTVDIAPSFSGTVFGITQIFICVSGFESTQLVNIFTAEKQNFEQWSNVFLVLAGVNLFGLIFYFVFGSADVQRWNFQKNQEPESQILKEIA